MIHKIPIRDINGLAIQLERKGLKEQAYSCKQLVLSCIEDKTKYIKFDDTIRGDYLWLKALKKAKLIEINRNVMVKLGLKSK